MDCQFRPVPTDISRTLPVSPLLRRPGLLFCDFDTDGGEESRKKTRIQPEDCYAHSIATTGSLTLFPEKTPKARFSEKNNAKKFVNNKSVRPSAITLRFRLHRIIICT